MKRAWKAGSGSSPAHRAGRPGLMLKFGEPNSAPSHKNRHNPPGPPPPRDNPQVTWGSAESSAVPPRGAHLELGDSGLGQSASSPMAADFGRVTNPTWCPLQR